MTRQTLADGSLRITDEQSKRAAIRMKLVQGRIESSEINYAEAWEKSVRIEQIGDEEKALHSKRDKLSSDGPDMAEQDRINERVQALSKEKAELMVFFFSGPWRMPQREWVALRNAQIALIEEVKQSPVGNRLELKERIYAIEVALWVVLDGQEAYKQLQAAYNAAGLREEEIKLYFPMAEVKAGSTERTEAQQRQVNLIKKVRELMQEQYDRGDKVIRMQALRDANASGELRRLGYRGVVLEQCRRLTDPNQVRQLGLEPLPR